MNIDRRAVLKGGVALFAATLAPACMSSTKRAQARVVVIGGGFGGMTVARTVKRLAPGMHVTLLEPKPNYVACPFSNLVLAGQRQMAEQTFDFTAAAAEDIDVIQLAATDIDPLARRVTLEGGRTIAYDRLVASPGISLDFEALPGYDEPASLKMPHAWQAGSQTTLLAGQLREMRDGGTVVIAAPANPYRCPPGPYERASLIAAYLSRAKPRSKVLILDNKNRFSKQSLFEAAWREHYGDMIEWQGVADGARVAGVDVRTMTIETDFDRVRADVANVIPPQRAANLMRDTGIADATGWCPIDAATFESTLAEGVHVIGDAAIANAMPKSAFAANAQAKLCALQVVRMLADREPVRTKLINTCYSLVTPEHGISVAGVYAPAETRWSEVEGAGGTSPADAPRDVRALEAQYARGWFDTIMLEVYG